MREGVMIKKIKNFCQAIKNFLAGLLEVVGRAEIERKKTIAEQGYDPISPPTTRPFSDL
jgi:hypothetical protein